MEPRDARTHLTVAGALHAAFGAIGIAFGVGLFLMLAVGGAGTGHPDAFVLFGGIGAIVGGLIILFSIPSMVAGIALLRRRSWSRTLALVVGALNLLNIPFGTALGIYTIWALTRPEIVQLLPAPAARA